MTPSAALVHTEAHMKEIGITLPAYQGQYSRIAASHAAPSLRHSAWKPAAPCSNKAIADAIVRNASRARPTTSL